MDTFLELDDRLPLTCSRAGTCCHGNLIYLNPWELACLARAKGCSPREFRDRYTTCGGIRLRLEGSHPGTCSQYDPARGCTVYAGRPLACRLFPLGRRREGETVRYLHRGRVFPCLEGCPEVVRLPTMTVAEFLGGQEVAAGEAAQDAYLEVMLELAEGALLLLLEGGLAARGDRETLPRWRQLAAMPDADRAAALPGDWLDLLTVPELEASQDAPANFVQQHFALLQARLESLAPPSSLLELRERCCMLMASALVLGRSARIEADGMMATWIATARQHGAV